jgi:hypothetical protein
MMGCGPVKRLWRLSDGLRIVDWRDGDRKGGLLRLKQIESTLSPGNPMQ